jgi:hypothetical protein
MSPLQILIGELEAIPLADMTERASEAEAELADYRYEQMRDERAA